MAAQRLSAAGFLVSYTTLAHIRAPRPLYLLRPGSGSFGILKDVTPRRVAIIRCRRPVARCPLADVRAAGSFKRYANAPRLDVVVLQALCVQGRASPPPALERLFPTSTRSQFLPREISWRILSYWRTDRDP